MAQEKSWGSFVAYLGSCGGFLRTLKFCFRARSQIIVCEGTCIALFIDIETHFDHPYSL